jgi:hypothetical protein
MQQKALFTTVLVMRQKHLIVLRRTLFSRELTTLHPHSSSKNMIKKNEKKYANL